MYQSMINQWMINNNQSMKGEQSINDKQKQSIEIIMYNSHMISQWWNNLVFHDFKWFIDGTNSKYF